jgi:hypothetical protein
MTSPTCTPGAVRKTRPYRGSNAYVQHDDNLTDIKIDSSLSSVRGDPRYGELLKKLKLPQ